MGAGAAGTSGAVRRCGWRGAALFAALVVAAGGCTAGAPEPAARPDRQVVVTVAASTSLRGVLGDVGEELSRERPNLRLRLRFANSSQLVRLVRSGAPVDVLATADAADTDQLAAAGLLAGPGTVFATNRVVVVRRSGAGTDVRTLADLAELAQREPVRLCSADSACGRYTEQAFAAAGVAVPTGDAVRRSPPDRVLAAVAEGNAVAGVVFATQARAARGAVDTIAVPESPVARYSLAVPRSSPRPEAAAAVVGRLTSAEGRDALRLAGFGPP